MTFREAGFETNYRLRRGHGRGVFTRRLFLRVQFREPAGQLHPGVQEKLQHVAHIRAVFRDGALVLSLPVIGLIRQAKPGLHQVGALLIATGILRDIVPSHAADPRAIQRTQRRRQLPNIFCI